MISSKRNKKPDEITNNYYFIKLSDTKINMLYSCMPSDVDEQHWQKASILSVSVTIFRHEWLVRRSKACHAGN